ncbi:mannan endo-1,4-beta-mannosidase [Paraoerskovia marina]|uniref:mannan endo-1,4-beta-mannosidase n=1 Tax=Paraoerskovia marina TaxID=545619 RepID=A0A1H1MN41_9CELL|nr:cellulase family glycosylhydrolase [Paraoerskovia marina]SDR88201.1 mannan endo-1,4-beta-mannosidase [Paraoerskovia marina]
MYRPRARARALAAGAVASALLLTATATTATASAPSAAPTSTTPTVTSPAAKKSGDSDGFVETKGARLVLDGKTFEFAGTNNYYLGYKSPEMADAVLDDAAEAGFDVVRTWGFQDFQNPDGSGSVHQNFEGVWYQAWDEDEGRPVVNEGADGLERLDHVVAAAGERGLRLVIPFTNNWNAFGGMDQYVRWAGGDSHADFYTDPQIRGWYKDWVSTLLNRVNTVTGVAYKDDPTIMAWELANEPRCTSAGAYPDGDCDADTITTWAAEMSAHVKSVDARHLLTAGDEGFFCRDENERVMDDRYGESGYGPDFGEDCADGVDTVALAALPDIDMMSMHLYPDHWRTTSEWGGGWIRQHALEAAKLRKPVYLGEFGVIDKATRMPVYADWLADVRRWGVDGALYWTLTAEQDDGTLYADYDGFTVYCPSPVCELVSTHASLVPWPDQHRIPGPIADHDTVVVETGQVASVDVLANDVAFVSTVSDRTLDLSDAPGRQTEVDLEGGSARISAAGVVDVQPDEGFTGTLTVPYTVKDRLRRSTSAVLTVTVKPVPGAPVVLGSWESGTEGWVPATWQSDPGSLTTSGDWATDGDSSLAISSNGAWFGSPEFDEPLDLSDRAALELDVRTADVGTSVALAVRSGDDWAWCQSPYVWVEPGSEDTVSVDIADLGCDTSTLTDVHDLLIFVNAGEFAVDRLTLL